MNKFSLFVLLGLMFFCGLIAGFGWGVSVSSRDMHKEIARRGFGAYKADPITGKVVFEWKEGAK